jgi:hypothetical protein
MFRLTAPRRSHCPTPLNPNLSTRRLQLLVIVYRWQHLLRSWHKCEQKMQRCRNSCPGKTRSLLEHAGLLEVWEAIETVCGRRYATHWRKLAEWALWSVPKNSDYVYRSPLLTAICTHTSHSYCNGVRGPSYHRHHYQKGVSAATTLDNTMRYIKKHFSLQL